MLKQNANYEWCGNNAATERNQTEKKTRKRREEASECGVILLLSHLHMLELS